MKIGFATCVQLGYKVIDAVLQSGHSLDMLITLEDDLSRSKSGRVYLDDIAAAHEIPLEKVKHINDASTTVRDAKLDWLFIVGWSQIAGPTLLASPSRGALGMHPTLLPEGRGRASIPWAIIKGLDETGVTLFQLDEGVDTGPILDQVRIPLGDDETASSLYAKASDAHVELALRVWPRLLADQIVATPQDPAAGSVWPGRKPSDGAIDQSMSVHDVDRLVRATTRPYPGAFFDQRDGSRVRIWQGRIGTAGPGEMELTFGDGSYAATEFSIESS